MNPETSWNQSLHVVAVNKGLEDEGDSGCEEEASVPSCKRSQPGRFWSVKTLHQDDIFIHLFLCDVTAICHIRPYLHDDNALDMLPVKESPTSNRQKRKEQIRTELRFLMSKLIKLTWCFLMFRAFVEFHLGWVVPHACLRFEEKSDEAAAWGRQTRGK